MTPPTMKNPNEAGGSWRFTCASSRDASAQRSHGTDRDCPTSKNSATTSPSSGATNLLASPG
jgi:hypothetical protein